VKSFLRWSVLSAALLIIAGGTASAQGQAMSQPATKVGVVNVGLLFTKYAKAQVFKKELEGDLAPLKAEAEKIKNVMQAHQEWIKKAGTTDPGQKEKSEKALRDGQRALEDLDLQARKLIGKKQEAQLVQLYKEIQAAVQSYGQQSGYHVIFAYGDPPDADLYTFGNINRKMSGMDMGGIVPFYIQNGLDVSNDVLQRLNYSYQQASGQTSTAPIVPVGGSSAVPK
jgi:Skp family chaperone for outer membrane proteins